MVEHELAVLSMTESALVAARLVALYSSGNASLQILGHETPRHIRSESGVKSALANGTR